MVKKSKDLSENVEKILKYDKISEKLIIVKQY